MSDANEWTSIGRTPEGGAVFLSPAGTPPPDMRRLRVVRTPPNPLLPPVPIPEPPQRSILRDAIEAVATITRLRRR
jgi:hypothetical protein